MSSAVQHVCSSYASNYWRVSKSIDPLCQTWSSLIDKDALEALPEVERKRQEAIFELILVCHFYVAVDRLLIVQ